MIARNDTLRPAGGPTGNTHAHDEACRELVGMLDGRAVGVPAELLARHVLRVTDGGDWPVMRSAAEAILRRAATRDQDELRIASRPAGGEVFGVYTTRRPRASERPYTTWVGGLEPLRASCDCRDFLLNSLGICKHVFAVLRDLVARKRLDRALSSPPRPFSDSVHLAWDPVRPLTGRGDWLDRVTLVRGAERAPAVGADGDAVAAPHARRAEVRNLNARIASGKLGADPAAAALLRAEEARLDAAHAQPLSEADVTAALASLRQKLYPYQRTGVDRFLAAGKLLLADDMGLGKTAQAIASCHVLWATGRVRRGLLIVPASLKPQWLREWQLFTDAPIALVDGNISQRHAAYEDTREGFLVANYEQVLRDLGPMHAWAPDLVVLDEAQRIKNWATKTAAYVKRLRPARRLVLTGTPMENRLDELASLMDWVDDQALEPKWRLAPWHTAWRDGREGAAGARHLDTLRERLAPSMLRRARSEVLTQLPSRTDTVVPVTLTDEQRSDHDALTPPIAQLVAQAKRRPLTQPQFLRLMSLLTTQRIIANGMAQLRFQETWPNVCERRCPDPALLDTLGTPKLRELREIVAQVAIGQGRRIVVFSQWRRMLRLADWAVSDLLVTNGLRAAFFSGDESRKRRTQNVIDFHDDPSLRVLFLTDAGGVGLNLQRAASCCVNIELPWNPAVLEQRIARIHRLGQRDPIDVYNLVSQESIEARIEGLVEGKRALFTGLFDGGSDEIRFERAGSFLSRMERLIEPVKVPDLGAPGDDAAPAGTADAASDALQADTEFEASPDEDAAADRVIEALVEAADETEDARETAAEAVEAGSADAAPAAASASGSVGDTEAGADAFARNGAERPVAGPAIDPDVAPRTAAPDEFTTDADDRAGAFAGDPAGTATGSGRPPKCDAPKYAGAGAAGGETTGASDAIPADGPAAHDPGPMARVEPSPEGGTSQVPPAWAQSDAAAVPSAPRFAADAVPVRDVPAPAPAPAPAPGADAAVVRRLFAGIEVRSTPGGGLRIDARPEAAATLASMLEGLAGLLRASASEPEVRERASVAD